MRRATLADIAEVNALLNDPTIRPHMGGEGWLDASEILADERQRLFFDDRGGAAFYWRGPGIYEGHSFFRVRGAEALAAGRECLAQMADAKMIWGATPMGNRAARYFNRRLGFRSLGPSAFPCGEQREIFVLEN